MLHFFTTTAVSVAVEVKPNLNPWVGLLVSVSIIVLTMVGSLLLAWNRLHKLNRVLREVEVIAVEDSPELTRSLQGAWCPECQVDTESWT